MPDLSGPLRHDGYKMASGTAGPHWHSTCVASPAYDTVVMGSALEVIQVLNRSASGPEIYYTLDGSTPSVGGSNCRVLPASICADIASDFSTTTIVTVKLISSGTPTYSVMAGS